MADLEYFAAMNDRQFREAVQRMERTVTDHSRRINGTIASDFERQTEKHVLGFKKSFLAVGAGAAGAVAFARTSLLEYARYSDDARFATDRLTGAWDHFKFSVGSNVHLTGIVDGMTSAVGKLEAAWASVANAVGLAIRYAESFGNKTPRLIVTLAANAASVAAGTMGPLEAAGKSLSAIGQVPILSAVDASIGQSTANAAIADREVSDVMGSLRLQATEAARSYRTIGGGAGADEIVMATAKRAEMLHEAGKRAAALTNPLTTSKLISTNQADEIEALITGPAGAAGDALVAAAKKRRDLSTSASKFDLGQADSRLRSDELRAKGLTKEADMMQVILRYEKARFDLARDITLEADDRLDRQTQLAGMERRELGLIEAQAQKITAARSLGGGLAGTAVAGLVFGRGPAVNSTERQSLHVQTQMRELLRSIERKIGNGRAAFN